MNHKRVVEIYVPYSSSAGTGYLIRDNLVLTAYHVVESYKSESEALCDLRFVGDIEAGKTEWLNGEGRLCWYDEKHDLALLEIEESRPSFLDEIEIDTQFGKLIGSEQNSAEAHGLGFPKVQKIDNRQNPEPLKGNISRLAGLKENQLRLEVTSPIPESSEEWAGISGTALFIQECLVGVVIETNKSFKEKVLWATPISVVAEDRTFCQLVHPNSKRLRLLDVDTTNLSQNIVISGLIFKILTQLSGSLKKCIKVQQFESLVKDKTENFVGREFIFHSITNLLRDPDFRSGYIVIRGEPGIGKSSLMAQLVKTRGFVHHFNSALMGIRSSEAFLQNICAQLIVRYDLNYTSLPPEAGKDSGFLSQLLVDIADKKQQQPVVILVDALDEADDLGLPPGANRLFLPPSLPEGIFFIVTSREENYYHLDVTHRRDIYLKDSDPLNLEDVRLYIRNYIQKHLTKMSPRIEQWRISEDDFIDAITEKSEGNFMYLFHVLHDIREGKLTQTNVDKIQNLPKGLQSYYKRHWDDMEIQDSQKFQDYYEPVVCQLAVAKEPISVNQLSEWTKLPPIRIKEVIRDWREFFNEFTPETGDYLYRIYHASFQTFLREDVGLKPYEVNVVKTISDKIQW